MPAAPSNGEPNSKANWGSADPGASFPAASFPSGGATPGRVVARPRDQDITVLIVWLGTLVTPGTFIVF